MAKKENASRGKGNGSETATFIWLLFFRTLRTGLICGTIVCVAYFIYHSVEVVAGKQTMFTATIKGILSANVNRYLYLLAIALLGVWGWNERRMRRNFVSRNHGRTKKLEEIIDSKRSSSGLTVKGDSPEKDNLL